MGTSTSSLAAEETPGVLADDISQAKPQEETSYWGEAFQFCNVDENDVDGRDDWDPHVSS